MKIVLRSDVANLGRKGDLVEVANGYARNFLLPRGLAMAATRGAVRQAEQMRRAREVRDIRARQGAEATARRLAGQRIEISARAGESGRLFGSVTAADVAAALTASTGVELDRRRIELDEPLKTAGTHEVKVRLHADIEALVTVEVVPLS